MPQATEAVRKPWHDKQVWVRVKGYLLPRVTGGGDYAAIRYLEKRGYVEHMGMIYAPKKKAEIDDWRPNEKETSALRYLVDEWDYSFDLRRHSDVLKSTLTSTMDALGPAFNRVKIGHAMQMYATLVKRLG